MFICEDTRSRIKFNPFKLKEATGSSNQLILKSENSFAFENACLIVAPLISFIPSSENSKIGLTPHSETPLII